MLYFVELKMFSAWVGALSAAVSRGSAPLVVGACRRGGTRLTAVIGGLVLALASLFTSFALQMHQVLLRYTLYTCTHARTQTAEPASREQSCRGGTDVCYSYTIMIMTKASSEEKESRLCAPHSLHILLPTDLSYLTPLCTPRFYKSSIKFTNFHRHKRSSNTHQGGREYIF